jgi:hypothetical protein
MIYYESHEIIENEGALKMNRRKQMRTAMELPQENQTMLG